MSNKLKNCPIHQKSYFVLFDDMNHGSPTRNAVSVKSIHHGLRDAFKQLVRTHLWLPKCLSHSHQLFFTSSTSNKVNWFSDATDKIHVADIRLECLWIKTSNNWLHKEWSKSPLIEHVGNHVGEGLWSHLSCLLQLIHIHPELNLLFD